MSRLITFKEVFVFLLWVLPCFPGPPLECVNGLGGDYKGTESKTSSGKTCQRWDTNSPHSPSQWPKIKADLESNFCRNPNEAEAGLWCYTTDPDVRWEYCNIPYCPGQLECVNGLGRDYKGTESKTETGKTCQRWDTDSPHSPSHWPPIIADLESNFCRNPGEGESGLWCYTTDPDTRWDYCNVPSCEQARTGPPLECAYGLGGDYNGTESKTESGKTCQRWDTNSPHEIFSRPRIKADLESNFCRNPNEGEAAPWCYTTDPDTRWEYCSVPLCPGQLECVNGIGRDYRGKESKTETGKTCQRWDTDSPQVRSYRPTLKADLDSNFCRNPEEPESGIWCYTTDPDTRWEFCGVPSCDQAATESPEKVDPSFSPVVTGSKWSIQVVQKKLCWSDALFYCRDFHWDLLSIRSEEEQREVEKALRDASFPITKHVWLGLRRYLRGETWFWMSGESIYFDNLKTGSYWRETSPCGGMDSGDPFHWRDFPCDEHLNFICQKDFQGEDERVEFYSSARP